MNIYEIRIPMLAVKEPSKDENILNGLVQISCRNQSFVRSGSWGTDLLPEFFDRVYLFSFPVNYLHIYNCTSNDQKSEPWPHQ